MRWCFHDCWISWVWYFLLHLAPYIFTQHCMTNSFTCVSSIKFEICSPSSFDPQVGWKITTRSYTVTHAPLALIFHTPDVYKCKALLYLFLTWVFFSLFCRSGLFWGDTYTHTFVSTDVGQIMCLYRIYKHGTRSVGRLRASPTSPLLC